MSSPLSSSPATFWPGASGHAGQGVSGAGDGRGSAGGGDVIDTAHVSHRRLLLLIDSYPFFVCYYRFACFVGFGNVSIYDVQKGTFHA